MNRPANQQHGFTLIEVLVSLAIFALAAVVLSMAYLNVIGSYREMGERQQAEQDWKWLRQDFLNVTDRKKAEEGGRLALPNGDTLNWTAHIEETEVADLFRVTLQAATAKTEGPEAWQRTQAIYLFRPAWSDPADREKLRDESRRRLEKARTS